MQTSFKHPKIDEARIIKALEALPDYKKSMFTKEQDALILKFVPLKGSAAVAEILGFKRKQIGERLRALRK